MNIFWASINRWSKKNLHFIESDRHIWTSGLCESWHVYCFLIIQGAFDCVSEDERE